MFVIGCTEAKICKKICVGKLSPRSTQCTPLHRSQSSNFCLKFAENLPKCLPIFAEFVRISLDVGQNWLRFCRIFCLKTLLIFQKKLWKNIFQQWTIKMFHLVVPRQAQPPSRRAACPRGRGSSPGGWEYHWKIKSLGDSKINFWGYRARFQLHYQIL